MPTNETISKRLLELLEQQLSLLTELKGLAPAECADPNTTEISLKPWQSALLALDDALWALDDLAGDFVVLAELEKSGRIKSSDDGNNKEEHDAGQVPMSEPSTSRSEETRAGGLEASSTGRCVPTHLGHLPWRRMPCPPWRASACRANGT